MRIPIQSGLGFRFDPGRHSEMKPAKSWPSRRRWRLLKPRASSRRGAGSRPAKAVRAGRGPAAGHDCVRDVRSDQPRTVALSGYALGGAPIALSTMADARRHGLISPHAIRILPLAIDLDMHRLRDA
jgi:hypothetical protein